MEALLGSNNHVEAKAADFAQLLVAEVALEVQRSLVGLVAVVKCFPSPILLLVNIVYFVCTTAVLLYGM